MSNTIQSDLVAIQDLISKGQYKEALTGLDHLTRKNPNESNLYALGGDCYAAMGHFDQAIACFKEAIKLKPDFAEAHNSCGFYYKEKHEYDNGLIYFKEAIKLKPDFAEAHNNLGICLYELGEPSKALSSHKRAIKLKPDFAEAHNNLGNILKLLGQVDEAILSYKRAIKLKPDFTIGLNNLASILIELGRIEEAKEFSVKARDADKDFEEGLLMLSQKNFTDAIKHFEISGFANWQEKVLECHYKNKEFDEFKKKLSETIDNKKHNSPSIAILSAHYAQNFKIKDPYNFCPSPLNFVCHEQISELIDNDQQLIKELIGDINNADILKRQYQSLFNGSPVEQSAGHIFRRPEKSFNKLSDALIKSINRYFLQYQNEDSEFINLFPKNIIFSSAWYVKMQSGGHLSSHIHEEGWISGAVYLAIPKNSGASKQEGAIELSSDGDQYPRLHDEFEKKVILPKEGDVIFFPSSVFHRTIPFKSNEERVCIAFDVKPEIM